MTTQRSWPITFHVAWLRFTPSRERSVIWYRNTTNNDVVPVVRRRQFFGTRLLALAAGQLSFWLVPVYIVRHSWRNAGLWQASWPCPALDLQLTGDHYVGKPSAEDQPTRPTQPFILSGSISERSELQLDARHLNRWRRHLVNAYEVKADMVFIAGKTVWSMPERFKVVCIPCFPLYKCSALYNMYTALSAIFFILPGVERAKFR